MLSLYLRQRICEKLAESKSFEELEGLKRASKEWCHTVLLLQWKEYDDASGPRWYIAEDKITTPSSFGPELKQARQYFSEGFLEYGHHLVKKLTFMM
jgi:hypothetical protein